MKEEKKEESLKEEKVTPVEEAPLDSKPGPSGDDTPKTEDDSETRFAKLEENLSKVEEVRDSYKEGMLKAQAENKTLKESSVEKPEASAKNENPVVDLTYAEREGRAQFKAKYPDEDIDKLLLYYHDKFDSYTATGIVQNLEEAMKYRDYQNNVSSSAQGSSQGAGVAEPSVESDKEPLTARQIEIAKLSGNDPKEVY